MGNSNPELAFTAFVDPPTVFASQRHNSTAFGSDRPTSLPPRLVAGPSSPPRRQTRDGASAVDDVQALSEAVNELRRSD
jgi:hypothetical protein